MDTKQLIAAVEKHAGVSNTDAEKAVHAVLDSLRNATHATMIFRKNEGRDAPVEARKQIYLCG
ncbi:MAG: hypothetical protein WBD81_24570 [Collimonas pratensis]|uniref:hypothetical protein n=1 Tax=Collimonas pratensis TaxID=279113 RepID=UPI003C7153E4